jgi:hypothetical protein
LRFIDLHGLKSRYYFGDNENPVKCTQESYIVGGLLIISGFILFFSILATGGVVIITIPVWVQVIAYISPTIAAIIFYEEGVRWMEDVDRDGEYELIVEQRFEGGGLRRSVIYNDGTIYRTDYNPENEIVFKWMMIPDPDNEGEYIIYVWDEETEQWLLDQNMNGNPDEQEKKDDSDNAQNDYSDSSSGDNEEGDLPEGVF